MDQEERLFGAPDRTIEFVIMGYRSQPNGGTTITVTMKSVMRQRNYQLHVSIPVEQSPSSAIGTLAPLLHLHYVTPARWVQQATRLADRLGAEGYEVYLK